MGVLKKVKNVETGLINFDFDLALNVGSCCLKEIKDGKFIYELFYQNQAENDMGFYYSTIMLDYPIKDVSDITKSCALTYTFNKSVLTYFVESKKQRFIDKARELGAEVFDEEYSYASTYRAGEPWASIDDAIKIAEDEIKTGNSKKN